MATRITIIGSGTLLPNHRHRSPGHLIETAGAKVLLDCGSGVVHGLSAEGRDWSAISHVAISHFHADHFGDLPALLWAWTHGVPRQERFPRVLIGPRGVSRVLDALASAYGDFIREPGGPLELLELADGDVWDAEGGGFVIRAHKTLHTEESIAFRVETETHAVGYTGDTGPLASLGAFFRGADVLISECAVADGSAAENHLSPAGVANLAAEARPDVLVLTHVYPEVDRDEIVNALRRAEFDGAIEVAGDGLVIELGRDPSGD